VTRPDSCSFNNIPGFRYVASLRGLRPNDFSCGFIFIEMTKIVVGSSSLTQPLLLYPALGPAMLDNIGGVGGEGGRQTIESIAPLQKIITCKMKSEPIMEIDTCNHFTSWERGVVHISYLPNRRSLSAEFNTADCSNSLI
jgi:hypothetical protein